MQPKVLVIGAGTAGKAAAIFLAKAGWQVTIVERQSRPASKQKNRFQVGESLPPMSQSILQQLGLWEPFLAQGHLSSPGNRSFWASTTETNRDYILRPEQQGWHLDRMAFEQLLLEEVEALGVKIAFGLNIAELQAITSGWQVKYKQSDSGLPKQYDYLLDASGRSAWLARNQGVERLSADWQLALVRLHEQSPEDEDRRSLIEATPQGWWYTAPIPDGRLVSNFFCRPNKEERQWWLQDDALGTLLEAAPHTRRRMGKPLRAPRFVAADSSVLRQPYGHHWLAIGDAALTFDPIASHGISFALLSARDAVSCLQSFHKGDIKAFLQYHHRLWTTYDYYVKEKRRLYQTVQRFGESRYWNIHLPTKAD